MSSTEDIVLPFESFSSSEVQASNPAVLRHTQFEAVTKTQAKRAQLNKLDICYGDIVTIRKRHSVSVWANGDDDGEDDLEDHDRLDDGHFLCTEFGGVVDEDLVVTATEPRFAYQTDPEPQNLRTSLFRVVPKLGCLAREHSLNMKEAAREREIYRNINTETLRESFGKVVMHGDVIQLQHVTTDKFITLKYRVSLPSSVQPST